MDDNLMEIGKGLKGADIGKYVSALFRAEEAFRKELADYEKNKSDGLQNVAVTDIVSGMLFKQLPLKYRIALKLPWQYAVEVLAGFLKEFGSGSIEEVVTGMVKAYIGATDEGPKAAD